MASFKSAFAAAKKAGKKTFSWEGKSFTTKIKEEGVKTPSKAPRPSAADRGKFAGVSSDDFPTPKSKPAQRASTIRPVFSPPSAKDAKTPGKMSEMDRAKNQFTASGRRTNAAYKANKK